MPPTPLFHVGAFAIFNQKEFDLPLIIPPRVVAVESMSADEDTKMEMLSSVDEHARANEKDTDFLFSETEDVAHQSPHHAEKQVVVESPAAVLSSPARMDKAEAIRGSAPLFSPIHKVGGSVLMQGLESDKGKYVTRSPPMLVEVIAFGAFPFPWQILFGRVIVFCLSLTLMLHI